MHFKCCLKMISIWRLWARKYLALTRLFFLLYSKLDFLFLEQLFEVANILHGCIDQSATVASGRANICTASVDFIRPLYEQDGPWQSGWDSALSFNCMHVYQLQGWKWFQWDPIFKLFAPLLSTTILRQPFEAFSTTSGSLCMDAWALPYAREWDPYQCASF